MSERLLVIDDEGYDLVGPSICVKASVRSGHGFYPITFTPKETHDVAALRARLAEQIGRAHV